MKPNVTVEDRLEALGAALRTRPRATDRVMDEVRALATSGATEALPSPSPRVRTTSRLGRIVMNRRFQLSAGALVSAAAILGFFLLWGGIIAKPLSAMEKMAEAIRRVKSCKCTQVVEDPELRQESLKPGEPAARIESVSTIYWLAPGSVRSEATRFPATWKGAGPQLIGIYSTGKPGIIISHKDRNYARIQPLNEGYGSTGCETLEELGKLSGKADRELGTKEINGKKARGFQIDKKKINADSTPGTREIWIDVESNLPVLVRDDMKWPDGSNQSLIIKDIQYNIDLDPKLFDTTPPEGYKDTTSEPLPLEEQVRQITKAMKIYAEVFGGRYPATHGDLVRAKLWAESRPS